MTIPPFPPYGPGHPLWPKQYRKPPNKKVPWWLAVVVYTLAAIAIGLFIYTLFTFTAS